MDECRRSSISGAASARKPAAGWRAQQMGGAARKIGTAAGIEVDKQTVMKYLGV
jgi:hypothetical protein